MAVEINVQRSLPAEMNKAVLSASDDFDCVTEVYPREIAKKQLPESDILRKALLKNCQTGYLRLKFPLLPLWFRKYVVVQGDEIAIYNMCSTLERRVKIAEVQKIVPTFSIFHAYCFELHLAGGGVLQFAADTVQSYAYWLTFFLKNGVDCSLMHHIMKTKCSTD